MFWLLGVGREDGGFEDADVGEVSVVAVVVEAVAHDEFIGDFEAGVVGLDGDASAGGLGEQDAGSDAGGLLFGDGIADELDGLSGVEDVVEDDDMAVPE